MTSLRLLALFLALPFALAGCPPSTGSGDDDDSSDDDDATGDDDDATPVDFAISSPDFVKPYFDNPRDCELALPVANACDGENPQIDWVGTPEGTVAFTLIFDDPTFNNYPHWAIYNIPADEVGLAAGISGRNITNDPPGDAVELDNGLGWNGYGGSCPGAVHQYRWRLWAQDALIDSNPASYGQLEDAAEAVSIEMVEMCHVFDGAEL